MQGTGTVPLADIDARRITHSKTLWLELAVPRLSDFRKVISLSKPGSGKRIFFFKLAARKAISLSKSCLESEFAFQHQLKADISDIHL